MKTIKPGTRVQRNVQIRADDINQDSRTIELAFSSEVPVERWFGREILGHDANQIRFDRMNSGSAPLLADHENSIDSQIGVIESVSIGADRVGRAKVRFGKSEFDEKIYQKVLDGIVRNVSVGYVVHSARLTGTDKDGLDTFLIDDWEPLEISLVAVPADATVGVGRSLDKDFIIDDGVIMTTEKEVPSADDVQRAAQDMVKRELDSINKRNAEIMTIGEGFADHDGVKLAARAIAEGKTVQEFQGVMLERVKNHKPESKPESKLPNYGEGAVVGERKENDPKAGFRNLGDFAASVMKDALGRGRDERLTRAASTFSNESSGPDGGFAVPIEFAQGIISMALEEQSLLSMCDNTPISGNTMRFPKDEGTPWGSTGITATWEGEGNQTTPTKESELKESELRLKKLKVLVPVTEELLADSTAMSSHITRKMGMRLDWKVQDAIVNGIGSGQPLGITKSAAYVSQAKETSQTADTINTNNIAKMFGRLIMGAGSNVVWLINPDAYNQVLTLVVGTQPVWTPPQSGFMSAPSGFLLGRPIIQTDTLQTLGDKFDVILANMSGYQAITKAGAAEMATSMHLWFDQDLTAFRLIFRMDGKPLLSAAVTPPNSSVTRAHFVTLDARA